MRDTKHEQIRRMTRFIRMIDSLEPGAKDKVFLSDLGQISKWAWRQVDFLTAPKLVKDLGTRAAYKKEEIQNISREFAEIIRAMEYDKNFDRENSVYIHEGCVSFYGSINDVTMPDFIGCATGAEKIEERLYEVNEKFSTN